MTSERARELYDEGLAAFRRGDQEASRAANEEALAVARAASDGDAQALALVGLARVAFRDHDWERTKELAREARELSSDGLRGLHMLAAATRLAGDYDAARELYLESLARNRERGNERMVAVELHNLAHVELHRGDVASAERLFAEWRLSVDPSSAYDASMDRLNAAAIEVARGRTREAEALLRRTEEKLAEAGIKLDPDDQFEVDDLRRRLSRAS